MGFLDFIFGKGGSDDKHVEFGRAGAWADCRIRELDAVRLKSAQPILDDIRGTVGRLGAGVERLSKQKLSDDVDERFAKIVRTNLPTYLKSMSNVVSSLKSSADDVGDLREYDGRLRESLDSIGKINFGDGRYLGFVFQDAMRGVHTECKNLLDEQEKLSELLEVSEEESSLRQVSERHAAFVRSEKERADMEDRIRKLEADLKVKQRTLSEHVDRINELSKKPDPAVEELKDRVGKTVEGRRDIEQSIHASISRLKRGLRKFEKYSPADSELTARIIEKPVNTFLECGQDEFNSMLSGFETAVREDKIKLKDKDKTVSRIREAVGTLTEEVRREHAELSAHEKELKAELEGMKAFREGEKLEEAARKLREDVDGLSEELRKSRGRLEDKKSEMDALRKELTEKMLALGVSVRG
ncbi:MAG: hypothetical protein ABIH11_04065 [Candidatus Altiarchaeota archaeon]